jgi:nitroreductase
MIEDLLNAARKAPSASNQQPWNFVVVAGEARERLCNNLLEACKKQSKHYDPSRGRTIPPIYLERTKKLLKAIRPHLNEMNQQAVPFLEEGSCMLYGAPVLILVTMDRAHPKSKFVDIGCAVENLVLAAHEKGLGTCIIALILMFEPVIRNQLEIAENQTPVVGIALGHPDKSLPVNNLRAPKEELAGITRWIGFC